MQNCLPQTKIINLFSAVFLGIYYKNKIFLSAPGRDRPKTRPPTKICAETNEERGGGEDP
jgi:hypothetical protein